jgi:hypothetical protein
MHSSELSSKKVLPHKILRSVKKTRIIEKKVQILLHYPTNKEGRKQSRSLQIKFFPVKRNKEFQLHLKMLKSLTFKVQRKFPPCHDCNQLLVSVYLNSMSIRNRGGEWQSLVLGIEPEACGVCGEGLYRNLTLLRGGWSRCSICQQFVHYSCLASGKISFLKMRPRVCKTCQAHSSSFEQHSPHQPMSSAIPS